VFNRQVMGQQFLHQKTLAFVGLSRDTKSFSMQAYKDLAAKSYRLYAANRNAQSINGEKCYASVADLPKRPGGAILFTPPAQTEKAVREAAQAGIRNLWVQRGAQSEAVLRFCTENGINAISGLCTFMLNEPVGSVHGVHRWLKGLFEALPC